MKWTWGDKGRTLQVVAETVGEDIILDLAKEYVFKGWRNHQGKMSWLFEKVIEGPTETTPETDR